MTISIPWSCVVALKLQPIGPINPRVFGLAYVGDWEDAAFVQLIGDDAPNVLHYPQYHILEPARVRVVRDALGGWVGSPTGNRHPSKHPWYTMLCNLHLALTEGE